LVITGYAHFPRVEELPSDVTVLMKPFRRKEFIFRVEELLNRKRKRADGQ
jgi:DNA-binding response OmpR family regulator